MIALQAAKVAQRAGLDAALAALTEGAPAPAVQRMLDRQAAAASGLGAVAAGKGKPPAELNSSGTPPGTLDTTQGPADDSKGGRRWDGKGDRRSLPRAMAGVSGSANVGWVNGSSADSSSHAARTPPQTLAGFAATPLGVSKASGGSRRSGSGAPSPAKSMRGFLPSPGSVDSSPMLLPDAFPTAERPLPDLTLPSQVQVVLCGFFCHLPCYSLQHLQRCKHGHASDEVRQSYTSTCPAQQLNCPSAHTTDMRLGGMSVMQIACTVPGA